MQNSLLNITAVSQLDLSEVILQAKLQLARIVWIVARRTDGCEGVGVGEGQISRLPKVRRVGQVEYLGAELEEGLAHRRKLPDERHIQAAERWAGHLGWAAAKVGNRRRGSGRRRWIGKGGGVEKLGCIV